MTTADWEQRTAQLWAAIDDYEAPDFRARIEALAAELPEGDAIRPFERASRTTPPASPSRPPRSTARRSPRA